MCGGSTLRTGTAKEEPGSPGDLLELSRLPLDSPCDPPEGSACSPGHILTRTVSVCLVPASNLCTELHNGLGQRSLLTYYGENKERKPKARMGHLIARPHSEARQS